MPISSTPITHCTNPAYAPSQTYDKQDILSLKKAKEAQEIITQWQGYTRTPLHKLSKIAQDIGIKEIYYKHEHHRFGLGSFKALGGAYAVYRLLAERVAHVTGSVPSPKELEDGTHSDITRTITVTTATDGNHGRSVAWGAQRFGCECIIYIHTLVSEGRKHAIAAYGAEVVRTEGNYDHCVKQCEEAAQANGRYIVSDTSWPGYMSVPKDVMQGYSVMVDEAIEQLGGVIPTHSILQGGVGGLPGAVCAHLWEYYSDKKPRFMVVEPDKADCLQRSCKAGKPTTVDGALDTIMAGLACGEISLLAWEILHPGTSDFFTVTDESVKECMRLLAKGEAATGVPAFVAGESAVAGLAATILICQNPALKEAAGLNENSTVLLFGTEGDTDPALYQQIVGKTADEVLAA